MTTAQIVGLAIIGILLFAAYIATEINGHYSLNKIKRRTVGDGQHGTARWATDAEVQRTTVSVPFTPELWRKGKNLPTTQGLIVNLNVSGKKRIAYVDDIDNHILMVAGPGGGKTTTFMIPNIEYTLACGLSSIVTDSKGDLLRQYGKLASEVYGYTVVNIDFRNPTRSDAYNFMSPINRYIDEAKRLAAAQNMNASRAAHSRAERHAKILSKSIVSIPGFAGGGQNAFFYDSAEGIITSIALLVAEHCAPEERHIVTVFKLISELLEVSPGQEKAKGAKRRLLHELLDCLPEDDKAKWFASAAIHAGGEAFASVMSTAISRLLSFIDTETEDILCHESKVTINDICEKKVIVFITFPEEDETKHPLVTQLLTQLMNETNAYADAHTKANRLPRRLYYLLDEFGIFPKMNNVVGHFGSLRSRNALIAACIQAPNQLKERYGAEGESSIRNCCATMIFGGLAPMSDTAAMFSKMLDTQTVASGSVSNNSTSRSGDTRYSRSENMISRALMTPDELQRLPFGSWVVARRGTHPFIGNLPHFSQWGIQPDSPFRAGENQYPPTRYASAASLTVKIVERFFSEHSDHPKASGESAPAPNATDYD